MKKTLELFCNATDLPAEVPDKNCGITVLDMEFDEEPKYIFASYYSQIHRGEEFTNEKI